MLICRNAEGIHGKKKVGNPCSMVSNAFDKSQTKAQVVRPSLALCSRLSCMSYTAKEVDIPLLKQY